ncbi:SLBB domain-containing protein [Pseudomonadota bacterium]
MGVSDQVSVDITNLGQREYTFTVRVPQNGVISVPLLGEAQIAGYTVQQAESMLESKLRDGYLKQPEVTIRVTEHRPFYVDGGVTRPGAFPFLQGLTVEKAIVLAGGFSKTADISSITISSEDDPEKEEAATLSTKIKPGDIVTIGSSIAQSAENIYLYGAVRRPGSIGYRAGLTVEKAIILAGGFTERASKKKITIRRETEDVIEEMKRSKLSAQLQPGDIITIGESFF